eukprot:TRINITY_DN7089_c0_g1_i3.p1 TRINITY_DN7089_c0_g1~~TRINITY_DN7089_c0_g1_i3.p1  ORF type:complete len:475 (-),score=91.12 TRINITY_DN7089_c0_g1_i3:140-1564(-)
MEPDPRRRSEHLETQVLEDGLMQSHFCKWARTSPSDQELAKEILVILEIRHVRKSWGKGSELSGKELQQHAGVVQAYQEILQSRIDSCVDMEHPDKTRGVSLLRRLQSHVSRHVDLQYRQVLLEAAHRQQLQVQHSVCAALGDRQLCETVREVVDCPEDMAAIEWVARVHDLIHSPDCAHCPQQLLTQIKPYICRTVTPFHQTNRIPRCPDTDQEVFVQLFEHIENEMGLFLKQAVIPFQSSTEFAQLRAKQICDPEDLDTIRRQVLLLKSKGIGTMIFDFDKTLVPLHTGTLHRSQLEQVHLTPVARLLLFTALAEALEVGVASFSDPGDAVLEDGMVSGEELIRMVLDNDNHGLGRELSSRVRIVAGHPEKMQQRGVKCACGHDHELPYSKHHHLHTLCPKLTTHSVRPSSILFFDDNMGNTVRARQEGLTGVDVNPETAIDWECWACAIEDAQYIPQEEDELPWSFERVQQ